MLKCGDCLTTVEPITNFNKGPVTSMQVPHYSNTRFGTKDYLCNAIKEICYLYHSPKRGPARSMLIERICYYRGCYYRGSTDSFTLQYEKKTYCIPKAAVVDCVTAQTGCLGHLHYRRQTAAPPAHDRAHVHRTSLNSCSRSAPRQLRRYHLPI